MPNPEPAFGAPNTVAQRRMQKELKDWSVNPPEGCTLQSAEPLYEWFIEMKGPPSALAELALYQDKLYILRVRFTNRYPIESPEVVFVNESPRHPHIYTNGHICLDILYDGGNGGWSPALTISKVCYSLRSMLASNSDDSRPIGDEDYCRKSRGKSPKTTSWSFDDDKV